MLKKYLNKVLNVTIDRPLGSKHPNNDIVYKVNYGYIKNTISGDGEEVDCYVLGTDKPIDKSCKVKVIAIIKRKNDCEDKLVGVLQNCTKTYTNEEIINLTNFQEKYFDIEVLR